MSTSLAIENIPDGAPRFPTERTGSLTYTATADIVSRLGALPVRRPCVRGDRGGPTEEVSWHFRVNGQDCAIWDYKGGARHGLWSTFGPAEVFTALFGWRYE